MSEVNPIHNGTVTTRFERVESASGASRLGSPETNGVRRLSTDSVDLSAEVRRIEPATTGDPIRADLVARVRAEIDAGAYETSERLDQALNSLTRFIGE